MTSDLSRLLNPKSVVIVGASEKPGALGNQVLANLERHSFSGDIHLVNPRRAVIAGRHALGSIEELPEGADRSLSMVVFGSYINWRNGPHLVDTYRSGSQHKTHK